MKPPPNTPPSPPPLTGPHLHNCPIFPADNVWNTPVDTLPVHPRSKAYLNSIGPNTRLHTDTSTQQKYGIPYSEIPEGTPPAKVVFRYDGESSPGPWPIPEDAPIEAQEVPVADHHILLIDPRRCLLYELWSTTHVGPHQWKAGSGVIFDLNKNNMGRAGYTSADAAGLPIFPGLIRYDEIEAGAIEHALRYTVPRTQAAYIWPASHMASRNLDLNLPPMGLRLRLRATFDISGFSPTNQIILTALKRYGMILADNGLGIFITGSPDKRWDDDDLHKLASITALDFEAVDESALQKTVNSTAIDPAALKP